MSGPRTDGFRDSPHAGIEARGFRRWHERQLVESFACLTTGVLSLIMTLIALEMVEFRSTPAGFLALVAIAIAGGALCIVAWRRPCSHRTQPTCFCRNASVRSRASFAAAAS